MTLHLDGLVARHLIARATVRDRKEAGLDYCELQGNMPISVPAFESLCDRQGIKIGFLHGLSTKLLSDDRGDKVMDLDLVEEKLTTRACVGVDFMGPESVFSKAGMSRLTAVHTRLAAIGARHPDRPPPVRRIHVGEGNLGRSEGKLSSREHRRALQNIELVLKTLEAIHGPESRVQVRLGHVAHLNFDQAKRIITMGLPAELNIHSNLTTGSVTTAEDSPLLRLEGASHGDRVTRVRWNRILAALRREAESERARPCGGHRRSLRRANSHPLE